MQNKLPKAFYDRISQIYSKQDQEILLSGFETSKRPVYFRINCIKSSREEVEEALKKSWLPFVKDTNLEHGYFLSEWKERDLWDLPLYKEGKIYVQSFSSQLPVQFMELQWWENVLDLTAAPGWKTGQISERVWVSGSVIALENNAIRLEKMKYNLEKLGCANVESIYMDASEIPLNPSLLKGKELQFDAILFDAPCSSEWKINFHMPKTYEGWDEKYFSFNYKRQKKIIEKNIGLLKSWWVLIYSTCTLAPEENEGIVHFLLCGFPELTLEDISFEYQYKRPWIKKFWKYIYKSEIEKCIRILPNPQSEGFFVAKLRKR